MARIPSQVVIQESPISASLDSLTEIVLGIAAQEGKAREAEKDRQFQKSQMYLESNLEALNKSREEHFKLRERATNLGIMELSADKVTDINKTNAFKAIVDTEGESITTSLNALNELNSEIQSNISTYSKGHTIAKNIDADLSGHISSDELLGYQQNEAKIREEQGLAPKPLGEAFTMGIQSWTMDPDKRLEMSLRGLEIAEKEEFAKWLPKNLLQKFELGELTKKQLTEEISKAKLLNEHQELINEYAPEKFKDEEAFRKLSYTELETQIDVLKLQREKFEMEKPFLESKFEDEETIRKQSIDTMGLTHEQLRHTIDIAKKYDGKKIDAQLSLIQVQVDAGKQAIRHARSEEDRKVLASAITSQEKNIQSQMENQDAIGVKLLTEISFELKKGVHTPLSSIVTLLQTNPDSDVLEEKITAIKKNERYSHIASDIVSLYESIVTSKTEPSVPDYSVFLQKIGDIKENHDDNQVLLSKKYIKDRIDKYVSYGILTSRTAVMRNTIKAIKSLYNDNTLTKKEYNTMIKAVQWEDSGIMNNPELINQAITSSEQLKSLRVTLNSQLALDANYAQEQSFPIFEE